NCLTFIYNKFLDQPLGELDFVPASKTRRLPTLPSRTERQKILHATEHPRNKAIFSLLYGSGFRINECLRLRVKDIDFNLNRILVHDSKGNKHRPTLLPTQLIPVLKTLIQEACIIQEKDNAQGIVSSIV